MISFENNSQRVTLRKYNPLPNFSLAVQKEQCAETEHLDLVNIFTISLGAIFKTHSHNFCSHLLSSLIIVYFRA